MTPEREKKSYIFLMLVDSYEGVYGEELGVNRKDLWSHRFWDVSPEGEGAAAFYAEVEMVMQVPPPAQGTESIRATVERCYRQQAATMLTAAEFVAEGDL